MEYKGYKIIGDKSFGYFQVRLATKGSIPNVLDGVYTTTEFAKRDIDRYLDGKAEAK